MEVKEEEEREMIRKYEEKKEI
jgi:hypothetical protein